jgi:hypothetical protein
MLNVAAEDEPTFVTLAEVPGLPVVTVPTAIVAAVPFDPEGPVMLAMIDHVPEIFFDTSPVDVLK